MLRILVLLFGLSFLAGCDQNPWNDPYPRGLAKSNSRFTSFFTSPKTLDPAKSYSQDETIILAQIYEPPLQYHYLKRPYTLIPLTLTKMPTLTYVNSQNGIVASNAGAKDVAFSVYDLELKPGIYYQPHPAFAKNKQGQYRYLNLKAEQVAEFSGLRDFESVGTRELTADDYVYEIKRFAKPGVNSSIFGLMATKIVGLQAFADNLTKVASKSNKFIDLREYPLPGAVALDKYHLRIILKGKYPQFLYWLAMPFFSPIPWEADRFYSQQGMDKKNLSFDWYPVGTGPYMLTENNPNRLMVLSKNPNFHTEFYPLEGTPADAAAGYLRNAGKRLPFIDNVFFVLEKESIPRWNKFLQGYYDLSAISSDSFDQAIQIDSAGHPNLTPQMKKRGIYLQTSISPTLSYIGFNMLDSVVGGNSERTRKLRLAISIAIDFEEYINIFLNGRGIPAQGPIPPGIFGHHEGPAGINRYVYDWTPRGAVRKPISVAKKLMKEAGYSNGIDPRTGEPLILNYDLPTTSGPDEKSLLDWLREQFAKIGIQLNIRGTEYNRFQEEMRVGQTQIFMWGWIADYPDPENFLFLLYGPNSKVLHGGENAANYRNAQFDKLFDQMKNLENNKERLAIIDQMLQTVRHDAPWVWGINPKDFVLNHVWNQPAKINSFSYNTLKYQRLNPLLRDKLQHQWNNKIFWPIAAFFLLIIVVSLPVIISYQRRERRSIKQRK